MSRPASALISRCRTSPRATAFAACPNCSAGFRSCGSCSCADNGDGMGDHGVEQVAEGVVLGPVGLADTGGVGGAGTQGVLAGGRRSPGDPPALPSVRVAAADLGRVAP